MLKAIFFTLLFTGCAKSIGPGIPNMHDFSGYPGAAFNSTNSPCIDGLMVNLGKSCATLVEFQGEGVITAVQCHQAKNKKSPWDKFTFYIVTDHHIGKPPQTIEFCADPVSVIYMRERL